MLRVTLAVVVGVLGVLLYVMAAVALADVVVPLNWAIQAVYYLAAGVLWVYPAHRLILWAARKPA
jgi:hypothetical protein